MGRFGPSHDLAVASRPFSFRAARSTHMRCFFKALLVSMALVTALSVSAQVPQAPDVAARSYLLLDVTANQILAEKGIESPVEPASLT